MATLAKLMGHGGVKAVVADSLLLKQQLLVINRSRQRAPKIKLINVMDYTPGNIQVISLRADRIKCDATVDGMYKIALYAKSLTGLGNIE
jgi:hypothetical protein